MSGNNIFLSYCKIENFTKFIFFTKNFFSKNRNLVLKFNPLEFNSKSSFSKNKKFFFNDLKNEYLDVIHSNFLVFSKYSNVCLDYDKSFYHDLDFEYCIFEINPNIFGREFSKTCSFRLSKYGDGKPCLFEVLTGDGFFILEDNNLGEVLIIKVKTGDYVLIEGRFSFVLINSSKTKNLTIFSLSSKDSKFEEKSLEVFNGANLYYTTHGFIRNLNSKYSYNLDNLYGDYLGDYSFDKEKGLYNESLLIPEKFNFLK
jgi:oxalate decarboxylase/phosphoglucose isomerase-like protein (cupin superfamily)